MKKTVHVVGAVIENAQGEILAALRGSDMTLPNYWEFPGGKIELHESPEEALKREIEEEVGCLIDIGKQVVDTTYEYEHIIVRLETYMATIISGKPIATEHAELRWVPISELLSLKFSR